MLEAGVEEGPRQEEGALVHRRAVAAPLGDEEAHAAARGLDRELPGHAAGHGRRGEPRRRPELAVGHAHHDALTLRLRPGGDGEPGLRRAEGIGREVDVAQAQGDEVAAAPGREGRDLEVVVEDASAARNGVVARP